MHRHSSSPCGGVLNWGGSRPTKSSGAAFGMELGDSATCHLLDAPSLACPVWGATFMCHEALVHPNLSCHVRFLLADVVSKLSNRYMVRQSSCCASRTSPPTRPDTRDPWSPSCIADSSCTIIPHLSRLRGTMMQCRDKFGSDYAVPDPRTESRGLLTVSISSPDKGLHAY